MSKHEFLVYNTATRSKEAFTSPDGSVGIYCCGPTVYDYAHLGNLRTYIWEDVLVRTLRALQYKVHHVMNITDVGHLVDDADSGEDKMEKGARREGKSAWDIAAHYLDVFHKDLAALNCLPPDTSCRATDHIPEMIALVKTLQEKGFTYQTGDGIYFDTSQFPTYCDFAHLDPEALRAGARIDMGDKRNPTDFALWKFSPAGTNRQMEWNSPWGIGFPGWHIECSAMSLRYLRQPIDIHCGGQEHVRIHHTNEIAQTEAATGKPFVRYWIHGEWVMFGGDKMSKSAGGVARVSDVVAAGISPLAYRMFVFSAHHRSPISFNWDSIQGAANGLKSLKRLLSDAGTRAAGSADTVAPERIDELLAPFWKAIGDDLNLPQAMATVWDLVRDRSIPDAQRLAAIGIADTILGLDLLVPSETETATLVVELDGVRVKVVSQKPIDNQRAQELAQLVVTRRMARKSRDFARADQIRLEMSAQGVSVNDLPDGSSECVIQ